jgi:hypothetical protein
MLNMALHRTTPCNQCEKPSRSISRLKKQDRNTASRSDGSTSNIGNGRSVPRTSAASSSASLRSSETVAALSRVCPVLRDGDHHQDEHAGPVSEA